LTVESPLEDLGLRWANHKRKASKQLEGKEKDLKKFLEQASDLYAQMLFAQSEDYMVAAFKVGNPKSATVQSVADDSKLDAELLDRWVKFLKKKPINYSFLKPWQDMVGKGGTAEEAKKLAHEFYLKVSEVNEKYFKLKQDNEIAFAQFKNEEQFDPLPNGLKRQLNKHQIDLKGQAREETYVWRDIFDQDLPELGQINVNADDKKKPGLLKLTDWALEKRLSADLAGHVTRAKARRSRGPRPPAPARSARAPPGRRLSLASGSPRHGRRSLMQVRCGRPGRGLSRRPDPR